MNLLSDKKRIGKRGLCVKHILREHYRFFNEKSNSYLSNLKLAIKETPIP